MQPAPAAPPGRDSTHFRAPGLRSGPLSSYSLVPPMLRLAKSLVAALPATSLLLGSATASADDPGAWKLPPPISAAPDDLSGHFMVAPRVSWLVPMGSADSLRPQRSATGTGAAFGLDLVYGISRYVDVHGRFDYGMLGRGADCPAAQDCSGRTTAFGLGLGYHLVNGAAFDPWLQAGIGYRMITFDQAGTKQSYGGLEWLHLAVGGEWYAARWFGVGPYLALDVGQYSSRPSEAQADSSIHSFFSLGMRGVIDPAR